MNNEINVKFFHRPRWLYPYTCAFYESNGNIYFAVARCHVHDNFNKRMGRLISSNRLLSTKPLVDFRSAVPITCIKKSDEKFKTHMIIQYVDSFVIQSVTTL